MPPTQAPTMILSLACTPSSMALLVATGMQSTARRRRSTGLLERGRFRIVFSPLK